MNPWTNAENLLLAVDLKVQEIVLLLIRFGLVTLSSVFSASPEVE